MAAPLGGVAKRTRRHSERTALVGRVGNRHRVAARHRCRRGAADRVRRGAAAVPARAAAARPGRDLRRTADLWERDLDALTEQAEGYAGPLKVQAAGPWTLAAALQLPVGGALLHDAGAIRDLTASLAEGLAGHVAEVRRRVPGAAVVLQVDEPTLPTVLAGRVPTESGFSTLAPVEEPVARDALAEVVAAAGGPVDRCGRGRAGPVAGLRARPARRGARRRLRALRGGVRRRRPAAGPGPRGGHRAGAVEQARAAGRPAARAGRGDGGVRRGRGLARGCPGRAAHRPGGGTAAAGLICRTQRLSFRVWKRRR